MSKYNPTYELGYTFKVNPKILQQYINIQCVFCNDGWLIGKNHQKIVCPQCNGNFYCTDIEAIAFIHAHILTEDHDIEYNVTLSFSNERKKTPLNYLTYNSITDLHLEEPKVNDKYTKLIFAMHEGFPYLYRETEVAFAVNELGSRKNDSQLKNFIIDENCFMTDYSNDYYIVFDLKC